jgi:hypothetical protein
MTPVNQNPRLKAAGIALIAAGMLLSVWIGPGLASLVSIVGIVLGSTGVDTKLMREGIKLGFTKISRRDIEDIYENGDSELVLVTRGRRRFRVKRWHYAPAEWDAVRSHIMHLNEEAEPQR